jgi:hypothetical protein
MKLRIGNYYLAYFIFRIIRFFWWGIFRRGSFFNQVIGYSAYKNEGSEKEEIDDYCLLEFR